MMNSRTESLKRGNEYIKESVSQLYNIENEIGWKP